MAIVDKPRSDSVNVYETPKVESDKSIGVDSSTKKKKVRERSIK